MGWTYPPKQYSISCNGPQVRVLREKLGWTQQELASAAGYTKRLVAKAEASGRLRPETIDILAETLSTHAFRVHPEDLTSSPMELAVAFMQAYAKHEEDMIAHCRHIFSEGFQGYFPGGADSAPLSGLHDGIEAYERFLHNFFRIFSRPDKKLALKTAIYTSSENHAMVAFAERIANDFMPLDAPPGQVVLKMTYFQGKLKTIECFFDSERFGQIVSRWREAHSGVC